MTFTDFIYGLGNIIDATLSFLPTLGNYANYSIIVIGVIGLFYWLNLQNKYNKKAAEEGTTP